MEVLIAPDYTDELRLFLLFAFLLCVVSLVCALVPVLLKIASSKLKLRLPPGPPALPFIGHLHLLGTHPHHSLCNLSKIYGPLMLLRFGSIPAVIASTPSMARQILQTHDKVFSSRPQPAGPMQLYNCEDILFSQPGPYWKLMRQFCATNLFCSKRLESFRPVITEEVTALLRSILDNPNNVPLRANLYAATSHIISRMVVGKRLPDLALLSQADPSYNLVTLLVEAINLAGVLNMGDFIPWLAWLDLQGCVRKIKAIGHKLHASLQEVIDERRQTHHRILSDSRHAHQKHDFLDVLIMSATKRRSDVLLKDLNIRAMLIDMYGAGIDTSAVSTEWALCELLANPTEMQALQEEMQRVVGMSRLIQGTDIAQLPYLCAVVKETMRLHPVGPLLLPHKASQECNIAGYDIPAGALAYVNVWAIGRDPEVWERPLEFRPERFLGREMDVRGQNFELIPFGSGRRACPGLMLGLTNMQLMLASLVHSFDWSTTHDQRNNMAEKFGLVVTPEKPLVATAIPRLPSHLFEVKNSAVQPAH